MDNTVTPVANWFAGGEHIYLIIAGWEDGRDSCTLVVSGLQRSERNFAENFESILKKSMRGKFKLRRLEDGRDSF